jgi:hypothetical protein
VAYHLTTTSDGESLTTTRRAVSGWAEAEPILAEGTSVARQHTLTRNGAVVVHLMVDGHRAHLSVWEGDTCHYLCGDRPDDAVDLGWNAYPGWSICETSAAIAAAREFVGTGRLVPTARWRCELVEL